MPEVFQKQIEEEAIPYWVKAMFFKIASKKESCQLRINFHDGRCTRRQTKVLADAEKYYDLFPNEQ